MSSPPTTPIDDLVEQTLWDGFWLPPWAQIVDRPELRFTHATVDQPGLNQVCRVRDRDAEGAPVDLAALVEEVDRAHRQIRSTWLLAPRSQLPALFPLLQARGWTEGHTHHLRTRSVDRPVRAAGSRDLVTCPVSDARTLTDCIAVSSRAFGQDPGPVAPERIADELGAVSRGRVHRFVVYDRATDTPIASAGLNTYPQLGIGFLWGGGTDPDHRARGAYRALLAARLSRAAALGCAHVAVYARHDTSDPILEHLGFERHGSMLAWERSTTPSGGPAEPA